MKALFLTFHGFHATNGISKKIHYQVRALEANGVETHLCYLSEKQGIKYRMLDQEILADYGDGIKGNYTNVLNSIRSSATLLKTRLIWYIFARTTMPIHSQLDWLVK